MVGGNFANSEYRIHFYNTIIGTTTNNASAVTDTQKKVLRITPPKGIIAEDGDSGGPLFVCDSIWKCKYIGILSTSTFTDISYKMLY